MYPIRSNIASFRKVLLTIGLILFLFLPSYANEIDKILRGGLEALLFFGVLIAFLIFLPFTFSARYPKYNFFTALNIFVFLIVFNSPKLIELLPNYFLIGQIGLQMVLSISIKLVQLADKRAEKLRK